MTTPPPQPSATSARRPSHSRAISTPAPRNLHNERQPLLRRRSFDEYEAEALDAETVTPVAGGTVLGVHNLSIVAPQLIVCHFISSCFFFLGKLKLLLQVALVTSAIFRIVDPADSDNENTYLGKNGVAWVLRFGGLCTVFGAILARRVAPTPTEKAMRRRLGEMKILGEENAP